MRRNLTILVAGIMVLLAGSIAAAGGGGNIRLARPVEKVSAGDVAIYLQALQHDVHPRNDAQVTATAAHPDGTKVTAKGLIDPQYGEANVYVVNIRLEKPGTWQVTIDAPGPIFFPPYQFAVEVLPPGEKAPDPGPVVPFKEAGSGHTHSHQPTPQQPQVQLQQQPAAEQSPAPAQGGSPWAYALGGAAGAAVLAGALLLLRRRGARPA